MIKDKIIHFLLTAIIGTACSSGIQPSNDGVNANRIPFTINPTDRKIVLPVQLNDSITANLTWDTGAPSSTFLLDSTFCALHPSITAHKIPDKVASQGSAWSNSRTRTVLYKTNPTVKIGNANINYSGMEVSDQKGYMVNPETDGVFNIPRNDTTHIWELNFEHNYLEIHSAQDFNIPKNSLICPLVKLSNNPYPFYIKLPIKMQCKDGDTLTLNRTFLIDTGMPWDIALMHRADELKFFNEQTDAVWTKHTIGYFRSYTVNATLFDSVKMDSLRIYTFDHINSILCDYLIGQNFLKRFNVFFDLKHQQIGLQPIKNFQRVIDPLYRRFHMSHPMNSEGKFIVTKVADYKENYAKIAGMKEGDEVIAINGVLCKEITNEIDRDIQKQDTLVYDILRKGKPMKIVMPKDKNEVQGD